MPKKKLNFHVDEELHRAIKTVAAEKGCSMTAVITHILYRTLYYKIEAIVELDKEMKDN